jgi:hypothetical protein
MINLRFWQKLSRASQDHVYRQFGVTFVYKHLTLYRLPAIANVRCGFFCSRRIIVILNLYIVSGSVEQLIGEPTAFSIPSTPMFGTGYTGAATSSLAPFRPPASGLAFGKSPTDPPSEVTPIKSMNCYLPAWTIRAQCTHKSEVRHWQTHVSTGKLCTVYLADESGEIQATMFNDAVDQLFPTFEVGKVFRVSNGKIKFANAKFSTIKHECELVLDTMTTVVPSYEKVETDSMHSFTTIDQVFQSSPNTVLGSLHPQLGNCFKLCAPNKKHHYNSNRRNWSSQIGRTARPTVYCYSGVDVKAHRSHLRRVYIPTTVSYTMGKGRGGVTGGCRCSTPCFGLQVGQNHQLQRGSTFQHHSERC